MANNSKEDYFIRIENPKYVRKLLLENARDTLKILKGYEDFKRIRDAKTNSINQFRTVMNEIRALVMQLKRTLPKTNIKLVKPVMAKTTVSTMAAERAPVREIKKLEDELSEIEAKLSELS